MRRAWPRLSHNTYWWWCTHGGLARICQKTNFKYKMHGATHNDLRMTHTFLKKTVSGVEGPNSKSTPNNEIIRIFSKDDAEWQRGTGLRRHGCTGSNQVHQGAAPQGVSISKGQGPSLSTGYTQRPPHGIGYIRGRSASRDRPRVWVHRGVGCIQGPGDADNWAIHTALVICAEHKRRGMRKYWTWMWNIHNA